MTEPVPRRLVDHLDALRGFGFAHVEHDSHVPFLSHLIGTRRVLTRWESRPALCDAGLYHSAYGTEFFDDPGLAVPSRATVRELIGSDAERLVWLWCSIRRETVDVDTGVAQLRDGTCTTMTAAELGDIATLWAADTVEQIDRMTASERGFARGLQRLLPFASDAARDATAAYGSFLPS